MQQLQEMAALAAKYVNTTDRHIFLTGKAGTGKTTFLKFIKDHTYKNTAIAAPTGIAAINAGGVTLHSLLQLPFGIFVPENVPLQSSSSPVNTPATLFRDRRFNASKRQLIRELELLVIDEVSMLRADLLDCIDHMLRYLRKRRHEPFGGLQILFIGDLMQLPPVVKEQDRSMLRPYYASPYFFEAHALREHPPVLVELQKIFRQSDQQFIDLLNRMRHNEQTREDLKQLNAHYHPDFDMEKAEGYIHLTTHNKKADRINETRLNSLEEKERHFYPEIAGDFPENMYPTGEVLTLKKGAQVMFIKNDPTGQGQFFNGKIGQVSDLSGGAIRVRFEDGQEIKVAPYVWENKRYVLNQTTNEVEEKFLGSFKQFPLKLAWAVTIHKSQGLTFDKALLDLSGTFAPGQLYVALSRLTSLEGLVLSSPLPEDPPEIDDSLRAFAQSFKSPEVLKADLRTHRKNFLMSYTQRAFGLETLVRELGYHEKTFDKSENRSLKQKYHQWTIELLSDTWALKDTGDKFIRQVEQMLQKDEPLPALAERMRKARSYFFEHLSGLEERVADQHKALKKEKQVKEYLKELENLQGLYDQQNRQIYKLSMLVEKAADNKVLTRADLRQSDLYKTKKGRKKSGDKTPSAQISYEMYKSGKSVDAIAEERGLVNSTVENHLSKYVAQGLLEVTDFLEKEKLNNIRSLVEKGIDKAGELRGALGDDYTYGEIHMALAYVRGMKKQEG